MNREDATTLNVAIVKAFGLDPQTIARYPYPTIRLEEAGPVITVTHHRFDQDGKAFTDETGDIATVLRSYKLVAIGDPMTCPDCGLPRSEAGHDCQGKNSKVQ